MHLWAEMQMRWEGRADGVCLAYQSIQLCISTATAIRGKSVKCAGSNVKNSINALRVKQPQGINQTHRTHTHRSSCVYSTIFIKSQLKRAANSIFLVSPKFLPRKLNPPPPPDASSSLHISIHFASDQNWSDCCGSRIRNPSKLRHCFLYATIKCA